MRHVIIRDDDANALTSPDVLERVYRPFLDAGMPVHLATIPEVRTNERTPEGALEGFLVGPDAGAPGTRPIGENAALLDYLLAEPGYRVVQHGLTHERIDGRFEFDHADRADIARRLDRGASLLEESGIARPSTFVAPQDGLSRTALDEVAGRFPIVSTGCFSLTKVPRRWWPTYLVAKKVVRRSHWRTRRNTFLTHPGCILSYHRDPATIMPTLRREILSRGVTVVVSHHWEYFAGGEENRPLLDALAELHAWLVARPDVKVIRFETAADLV